MTFDQFYSGYQCVSFGYLWLNVPGKPRMMRQKVRKDRNDILGLQQEQSQNL